MTLGIPVPSDVEIQEALMESNNDIGVAVQALLESVFG